MCLIAVAYKQHHRYPLLLAANRDEFYRRPARTAQFWKEHPQILAGKDMEAGGTWLGITSQGRFAAITNYREEGDGGKSWPRSRGELTRNFLAGNQTATGFLNHIKPYDDEYAGFNLLLLDQSGLYCYSNRDSIIQHLSPGIYGLSNHQIDTPWPKVRKAKQRFRELLQGDRISHNTLFSVIADETPVSEHELPEISPGMDVEWAKQVSAQFIRSTEYGTRASTTLSISNAGEVEFRELNFNPMGNPGEQQEYRFTIS